MANLHFLLRFLGRDEGGSWRRFAVGASVEMVAKSGIAFRGCVGRLYVLLVSNCLARARVDIVLMEWLFVKLAARNDGSFRSQVNAELLELDHLDVGAGPRKLDQGFDDGFGLVALSVDSFGVLET